MPIPISTHHLVSLELDPTVTPEQEREGLAREVLRKIQAARKAADFNLDDRIRLELFCDGKLKEGVAAHEAMIKREALVVEFAWREAPKGTHVETVELEEGKVCIGVTAVRT